MGAFTSIFKSNKKLTTILVLCTFFVSNFITVTMPENDPRRLRLVVKVLHAAAVKQGLPEPLRPYTGSSRTMNRSLYDKMTKKSRSVATQQLAMAERNYTLDELDGRSTRRNNIAAEQVVENAENFKAAEMAERDRFVSQRFKNQEGAPQLVQNAPKNFANGAEVAADGGIPMEDLELPPINPGDVEADAKKFTDKYGYKKGAGRQGVRESGQGIKDNDALIGYNNARRRGYNGRLGSRSRYPAREYRNIDKPGAQENEREAVEAIRADIQAGQDDLAKDASDMTDKSNEKAEESKGMFAAAIALLVLGMVMMSIPGMKAIGMMLIMAGIALMMLAKKKGAENDDSEAKKYSDMADSMYKDGLDPTFPKDDYVNTRLEERDTVVNRSRGAVYSSERPSTYGRGDVRTKQKVYRGVNYDTGAGRSTRGSTIKSNIRQRRDPSWNTTRSK
jgi:hypothetical protein